MRKQQQTEKEILEFTGSFRLLYEYSNLTPYPHGRGTGIDLR